MNTGRLKYCGFLLLMGFCLPAFAQYTTDTGNTQKKANILLYYHSIKEGTPAPQYTKLVYKRPNNQLMSWTNYPSTAEAVTRRINQNARDNRVQNIIAKEIIKSVFSKKKKNAVIPQY